MSDQYLGVHDSDLALGRRTYHRAVTAGSPVYS